jgi:tetratricopeptide (TPR) repeat protein
MSKNKQKQTKQSSRSPVTRKMETSWTGNPWIWAMGTCMVTAIVFLPMFSNEFTNWDDPLYVLENALLRGPDWAGIFSKTVVSNYHPLTMATLAFNYQASELEPFSYHLVNWLLHIINTGLVFFFAFKLSQRNIWVGVITALFFGIHPMHVESVAWVSERKDVLYTAFFMLALITYLEYVQKNGRQKYLMTMLFFIASLLSKPAAVTFPVVLLLIDWYKGRLLKDKMVWMEKLPFFILALVFGVVALQIQSEKAIAQPEFYPVWQRFVFALYGFGEYIKRLFWPFPLSTLHPFPASATVPASWYPALMLTPIVIALAVYFRKDKNVIFGLTFFAVNLALVLQLLTFGNSVISERYTYVPYIGLCFGLAMLWAKSAMSTSAKNVLLGLFLVTSLGFAVVANRQVKVWKDSMSLWTKAIEAYPSSYIARSNRGNYLVTQLGKNDEGLVDYNIALEVKPEHANSLENRCIIYLHKKDFAAALKDAEQLIEFYPTTGKGYYLRGFVEDKLGQQEQAIADYSKSTELDPINPEAWANRGIIYYNVKQDYNAAKADFEAAIQNNPKNGVYVINRARCWIALGNKPEALKDIELAKQLGAAVPDDVINAAQTLN